MIRTVVLLVAVLCCAASAVAYRESYREQDLGRGRYLITTVANEYNSNGDAHQFAFTRAKELCPDGFDIVSQDGSATSHTNAFYSGKNNTPIFINSEKHQVALVVQCLPPGEAPEQTAARATAAAITAPTP